MAKSDDDFYKRINKEIMSWDDLVKDQKTYDALQRLANSTIAKMAWLELSKKVITQDIEERNVFNRDIFNIAHWIGRKSVNGYLDDSEKLTSQEIKEVSSKAVKLASELRQLILGNSILRFNGEDLMPEDERAAYSRITQGLINQICEINHNNKDDEGRIFSTEIEAIIDEGYAENHPEFKDMSSIDAYKILRHRQIFDDGFIHSLELFEKLVKDFTPSPILPRPKKELADENVYAVMVCESLNNAYGSPLFEISTSLCTAFFDHDFEVDTIKKWWQRRLDTSH